MPPYVKDPALNFYRRKDFGGIAYSDGAVERRILEVVRAATDRGTFSDELKNAIADWPSEYHLSRQRHCLMRPLGIAPGDKVLEIGCGCGAITRFLGELGADVTAVEGSPTRAEIAAERCRDLPNVRIIADDLLQLDLEGRFDWVSFIGVLEYAPVFSKQPEAAQHYLDTALKFLRPRGRLVVAIENKLGVKYFNNCAEDHVGAAFFGVQGLYGQGTARTFGKRELEEQLRTAGLRHVEFYYPFPDYKLPHVILSDAALQDGEFAPAELLASVHSRDYTGGAYRVFDEPLVLREAARNGVLGDLSNSFLVVAARNAVKRTSTPTWLAEAYATQRTAQFATRTSFVRSGDTVRVTKEPLTERTSHECSFAGATLTNAIGEAEYIPGELLVWRLMAARARHATVDQMVEVLAPWFDLVLQQAAGPAASNAGTRNLSAFQLEGRHLDLAPFNLIESGGALRAIDQEWQIDQAIPLGWVVTRSVLHALAVPGFEASPAPMLDVIRRLSARHGIEVAEADVAQWLQLEAALQSTIVGRQSPVLPPSVSSQRALPLHLLVRERELALAQQEAKLGELARALAEREDKIQTLQSELQAALTKHDQSAFATAPADQSGQRLAQAEQEILGLAEQQAALAQQLNSVVEAQTQQREQFNTPVAQVLQQLQKLLNAQSQQLDEVTARMGRLMPEPALS